MSKELEGDGGLEVSVSLVKALGELPDPRVRGRTAHLLLDVVVIAIIAHLCGCDDWVEVALFGRTREAFLRKFLVLGRGIPSHDTFRRIFMILNPEELERVYANWIRTAVEVVEGQVIAIDGKEIRRSATKGKGVGPGPARVVRLELAEGATAAPVQKGGAVQL